LRLAWGLQDRGIEVRFPGRTKIFLFSAVFTPSLGSTPPRFKWILMVHFPVVVQQGCEPDHFPPSSTDINNEWSYSFMPSICHYGVYKDLSSTWRSRPLYSQSWVHVLGKIKISRPLQSRTKVFQSSISNPIPCIAEVSGSSYFYILPPYRKVFRTKWIGVCMKYPFVVSKEFHLVKILINILYAVFLWRVVHVLIS